MPIPMGWVTGHLLLSFSSPTLHDRVSGVNLPHPQCRPTESRLRRNP
jgi:hypothetical protein